MSVMIQTSVWGATHAENVVGGSTGPRSQNRRSSAGRVEASPCLRTRASKGDMFASAVNGIHAGQRLGWCTVTPRLQPGLSLGRPGRTMPRAATAALEASKANTELVKWLISKGLPPQRVILDNCKGEGVGVIADTRLEPNDVAIRIPDSLAVTSVDVNKNPVLAAAAKGRGDIIGFTLWLMMERLKGASSEWAPYVASLPSETMSPLLWTQQERDALLKPCFARKEAETRLKSLQETFNELEATAFSQDRQNFPVDAFSFEAFKAAFCVIMSRVIYLPTADCFALVPLADCLNHRSSCNAVLDFDIDTSTVVLKVDRAYNVGDQVVVNYGLGKPNWELLLSYGFVDDKNDYDYLEYKTSLVAVDKLYSFKKQILQDAGMDVSETFPLFKDRFPTQLLSFVRLARIQDPLLFTRVTFAKDQIISQENEYESLMLVMGDIREQRMAFDLNAEDELKLLQGNEMSPKERLAARARVSEITILSGTMDGVRRRLAPIRGIPTKKGGMQDPNADLNEVFDTIENVFSAPGKLLGGLFGNKDKK
eukprot:jgi/Mesvir1/23825/Mv10632-RA.1